MKKICNLTEEQLRQLYIGEQKTIREISQLTAWHCATIFQHLKKLNIPRRRTHYFQKNHIAWNKGTKGIMKPNSASFKKDMIPWNKGLKGYKPEHNGRFKKGQVAWNKGMKLPQEWIEKTRLANLERIFQ